MDPGIRDVVPHFARPANDAQTMPRGRQDMFLKAILSTYPTLCRRPSGDLLPTVGEPLNTAVPFFRVLSHFAMDAFWDSTFL